MVLNNSPCMNHFTDVQITAGRKANGGKVRIDATGPNGTIALHSDQLYWTMSASNSSSLLDSVEHGDTHEGGTHQARRVHHDDHSRTAMMRVGADGLNVHEMTTVNLSARSFFSLAVVGTPRPVREVIHGGTISGNERSVNISGGAVGVKVGACFTPFADGENGVNQYMVRVYGRNGCTEMGPSLPCSSALPWYQTFIRLSTISQLLSCFAMLDTLGTPSLFDRR